MCFTKPKLQRTTTTIKNKSKLVMKRFLLIFLFISNLFMLQAQNQTIGLFLNTPTSYNGYTLLAPSTSRSTFLIDNCGEVVHSWSSSDYMPGAVVYLLPDGSLLRTARIQGNFNGGGIGGRIEIYDWDDNLIWEFNYANENVHQHHDVEVLPNGNILILSWERFTEDEIIEAGRNTASLPSAGIWPEHIIEVIPVGTNEADIVWEWHLWDHLVQDFDSTKANYGIVKDHPELMDLNFNIGAGGPAGSSDWIHANAIDYNPQLDQIMLSSRHLSEIWIIDHSTTTEEAASHSGGNAGKGGDFLYRWGNPRAYDRGTVINQKFYGQHDAQWIEAGLPDEGKIMVFNNGQGRPDGNYSSVDIITPPLNSDGTYTIEDENAYGPEEQFWRYTTTANDFYSPRVSGAQRLPNGNTLICEGVKGRIFEVDQTSGTHWYYVSPVIGGNIAPQGTQANANDVFRAYRYPIDFSAFEGKDLTPQGLLETDPLPSDCQIYENDVANENIFDKIAFKIYPNPANDILSIKWNSNKAESIKFYNLIGQEIVNYEGINGELILDASDWKKGIYFVKVGNSTSQKIIIQ